MTTPVMSWLGLSLAIVCAPAVALGQVDSPAADGVAFFEKRIRPLLVEHCYRCHSKDAKKVRGNLFLDTRDGVRKGGSSGPALVPGKPDESLLIQAVRHRIDLRMPPKEKLAPAELADLETWVRLGAPDPRVDASPSRKAGGVDLEEGKKFWSFRPVRRTSLPQVRDQAWPRSPIDRFILKGLETRGLTPVRDADRRTLLRRVSYDLTGLPPTPEDIEAFLKDASADAYARVVDRLLASPAYGERWGRHWLDVVRYADTAGDNSDYPVPQMIRYRDWVIAAFNRDLPFDRFLREQLAGDLMTPENDADRRDKLIATGYLANSRRHGSYEDARYPWHLTIEDTLDNLGRAFLGLTINCCRCHDHKFDPLTTEDYYALYGFFSSTRYPWPGIELDRVQRDLVPLDASPIVEKALQERQERVARLEAAVKRRETEKADAEKKQRTEGGASALVDAAGKALVAAKQKRDAVAKAPLPFEMAYAVVDGQSEAKKRIGQVGNARVQIKGDPDRPGKEVPRRFPLVLGGRGLPESVTGSGRLILAEAIADPANPLTARVLVNRVWQQHFGRGIVPTPNDFGKQGRPPTHPELLDYLAARFVAEGWSIKSLHRLLVTSRTYQLSSDDHEANRQKDPDNESLWRFARRRLDAEAIRDTLLEVGGGLDRSPGGPHPFPSPKTWDFSQHKPFKAVYDSERRSVYLMTQRIQRHPFLALFDGPDTNASTATRVVSTTPLQSLFLMNDPLVHRQAQRFAARILGEREEDADRIDLAFLRALGRPASPEEQTQAQQYLVEVKSELRRGGVLETDLAHLAWESLARAIFMSNEFVYLN